LEYEKYMNHTKRLVPFII